MYTKNTDIASVVLSSIYLDQLMKIFKLLNINHYSKYFLFIVIPLHFLSLGFFWYLPEFKFVTFFYIFIVYTLIGGIGLEIGFHRMLAHKNFKPQNSLIEIFFIFLGTLACQGSSLAWIALHQNHHTHVDEQNDYQSPKHGLWSSYIGWTADIGLNKKIRITYMKDLIRSRSHLFFDKHYYKIIWSVNIMVGLISPVFLFTIFLPGLLLSFHVSSVNNLIGHNLKWGKRPFVVADWSTDVWWAALFSWGISFQNTHHANPEEINYAKYSGGIDTGYWLFLALNKMNLFNKSALFKLNYNKNN